MSDEQKRKEFVRDFVSGTVAGIAITLVGQPFDTIKVRLQTQGLAPGSAPQFRGALHGVSHTIRNEGFFALFKGMGSPLLTVPIVNAIVFASYEGSKRYLVRRENDPRIHLEDPDSIPMHTLTAAGTVSGFANSIVVSPVELIKTRLQVQYDNHAGTRLYAGPLDCLKQTLRTRGVRGLYRGMAATVYREIPAYAAQFYTYETLKRALVPAGGSTKDLGPATLMLCGGTAGVMCWAASYPQDIIKSRLQVQLDSASPLYKPNRWLFDGGFIDCWRQTTRVDGFRALWKGFSACVLRAFPANAAGFLAYELCSKTMKELEGGGKP